MKCTTVTCYGRSSTLPLYIGVLFVLLQLSLTTANHYYEAMGEPSVTYELVCPENEELHDTMPCCEPTCDNDCTSAKCSKAYVQQPTCVCKQGYVRYKNKCILPRQCPPKPPAPVTCGENEELLPSPPSCEPTCTEDCTGGPVHSRYVDQPTCVCKKGYRRHRGKCIRVDQCPSCGPYATLKAHVPCCEPTCDNDCSNVLCIDGYQREEPVCVCQDGYVKHNSTCIKRELCPQTMYPVPMQYCRCNVRRKPKGRVPVPVKVIEVNTPAPPCSCYKQQVNDGRTGGDHYPTASCSPIMSPSYSPTTSAPPRPHPPPCSCHKQHVNDGRTGGDHYPTASYSPILNYVSPSPTTSAPPLPPPPPPPCQHAFTFPPLSYGPPVTYSPPPYVPGPYVPPPTYAPPPCMHTQPPTTCAPPTNAPPKQYYQHPPVYAVPPPPPPPYAYTPPPMVEASTFASVTVQPPYAFPQSATLKPYYQQPPSSYQDQPYYAIPALKQCSCNINAGQVTSSPSCACGNNRYPPHTQTYNRPPISYNVATPSTTTVAPTTTVCPPVACNQCNQQQYIAPGSYQQDQPYLPQQMTTPGPLPVDVSYIPLAGPNCPNTGAGTSGTGTDTSTLLSVGSGPSVIGVLKR